MDSPILQRMQALSIILALHIQYVRDIAPHDARWLPKLHTTHIFTQQCSDVEKDGGTLMIYQGEKYFLEVSSRLLLRPC